MVEMTFNQYETKLVPEYEYFLIDTNETIKNLPIGFISKLFFLLNNTYI